MAKEERASNLPELEAKQYAIADFDFMWCQRYLVAYIELMTPSASEAADLWRAAKSREFPDENVNFLDTLGRSLVTSIVISYSRPWLENRRADGPPVSLSKTIFCDLAKVFRRDDDTQRLLPFHLAVHKRVLAERQKVIAHSDFTKWDSVIHRADRHSITTKLKDPFHYLSLTDARQLLENTRSLRSQLNSYKREVSSKRRKTTP